MYRVEHGLRLLTPMFEYIVPAQTALVPDDETWQRRPRSFAVLGARKRRDYYIDSPKAVEFARSIHRITLPGFASSKSLWYVKCSLVEVTINVTESRTPS
ncbi:hypothetical protein AeNC1_017019 [Aphanomyces euteiches]|nr:hypothetical protein AeNC1_017019 [Aphanomyces euteiches]